jgi:ABC-2 type transport system permease protein
VAATVASCTLATVAYAGVFVWLGLRVRRALVWGLAYILVWEGFVAQAGGTAALLAIRSHTRSLLARLAGGAEELVEVSLATALVLPMVAATVALALAVRRLTRQDVA